MIENRLPRVLIISRGVWDDTLGISSTLTNLFEDYTPEKLAHLYIETKRPNTRCCFRFFQISEYSLVRKLWRWRLKAGRAFDTRSVVNLDDLKNTAAKEAETMNYVRGHRLLFFSFLREVLWGFNGWKSKELIAFIKDFNPDVIWLDGSPLPLMNRLYDYVLKIAQKPASIFLQDDVYTYDSCGGGIWEKIHKFHLRRTVKRVVSQCSNVFVASPKMKREFDHVFGIDSVFIAKSFNLVDTSERHRLRHNPLRMVYMGQVLYGRIKTLISIVEAMAKVNKDAPCIQLFIYTNNQICDEDKRHLLEKGSVFLKDPVPYSNVPDVISDNDVLVFVETFEARLNKIARLSFSTKISDYLRSGKCIFAIGPADLAPIEYFVEEDAAIVATGMEMIGECLERIASEPLLVDNYAEKAYACALRNHNRQDMNNRIYGKLAEIANIDSVL